MPAKVTRTVVGTSNVKSRTLRAEIDMPNTGLRLLPGMYAYGKVIIERKGVRALPIDRSSYSGEQTFCWRYEAAKRCDGDRDRRQRRRVDRGLQSPAGAARREARKRSLGHRSTGRNR